MKTAEHFLFYWKTPNKSSDDTERLTLSNGLNQNQLSKDILLLLGLVFIYLNYIQLNFENWYRDLLQNHLNTGSDLYKLKHMMSAKINNWCILR